MATSSGDAGQPNQDFVGAVPGAVVLLDGAGIPRRAARLAREIGTALAFVSVRPPLPAVPRRDHDEHRLSRDLFYSRKALDTALAAAAKHGVMAYGEIVAGDPVTQILEFATSRNAPVLVVGQRRQAAEPSVSRQLIALSARPVVVAAEDTSGAGD